MVISVMNEKLRTLAGLQTITAMPLALAIRARRTFAHRYISRAATAPRKAPRYLVCGLKPKTDDHYAPPSITCSTGSASAKPAKRHSARCGETI